MRIAVSLLVLALAACTPPQETYPPQVEMNFRNACEAQDPPSGFCGCVWERVLAEVRPSDLIALEQLPINERENHPLTQQINGFAMACHAQLQSADENTPTLEESAEQPPAP